MRRATSVIQLWMCGKPLYHRLNIILCGSATRQVGASSETASVALAWTPEQRHRKRCVCAEFVSVLGADQCLRNRKFQVNDVLAPKYQAELRPRACVFSVVKRADELSIFGLFGVSVSSSAKKSETLGNSPSTSTCLILHCNAELKSGCVARKVGGAAAVAARNVLLLFQVFKRRLKENRQVKYTSWPHVQVEAEKAKRDFPHTGHICDNYRTNVLNCWQDN